MKRPEATIPGKKVKDFLEALDPDLESGIGAAKIDANGLDRNLLKQSSLALPV